MRWPGRTSWLFWMMCGAVIERVGKLSYMHPFECGSEGGKILVTTRLDKVASVVKTKHNQVHNLSLLDEEQCWSVFANRAWGPVESGDHSAFEEIGRKIVEKCKGLSLAAQTVGGSFFQHSNSKEDSFVIHDLMHDLATFYGGKFFSRTFELKSAAKYDDKTLHLSYLLHEDNAISKISKDVVV
ncbi:hypothetical protein PIB30_012438 [Stylosanthes scabra]|uniref:NB-ARC domain-containing protein n=1 Tax=Stylosanthes scabra TaxID=79078 RepID=A0ABU6S6T2_9FABA|nr:hypothetical protein [Stylosanthes scabra]